MFMTWDYTIQPQYPQQKSGTKLHFCIFVPESARHNQGTKLHFCIFVPSHFLFA